jgi:hypothetical protein
LTCLDATLIVLPPPPLLKARVWAIIAMTVQREVLIISRLLQSRRVGPLPQEMPLGRRAVMNLGQPVWHSKTRRIEILGQGNGRRGGPSHWTIAPAHRLAASLVEGRFQEGRTSPTAEDQWFCRGACLIESIAPPQANLPLLPLCLNSPRTTQTKSSSQREGAMSNRPWRKLVSRRSNRG